MTRFLPFATTFVSVFVSTFVSVLASVFAPAFVFALVSSLWLATASPAAAGQSFAAWVSDLRVEAVGGGLISGPLFDEVFADIAPIERIIELDRRQPEFTQSFSGYYGLRVTDERTERGKQVLAEHRSLLDEVHRLYGVPPEILAAFWGMETAYGKHLGKYNTVAALATLAYDERRSAFFRRELLAALRLLEERALTPAEYQGSWAGAVGHMQFMPSTYRAYAIDGDGDGQRNLFASLPDAFHSAGKFLHALGWQGDAPWGEEVLLPAGFEDFALASVRTPPETRKPRATWAALGVSRKDGTALPADKVSAALLLPSGAKGPAFLVYPNYNRILNWNRSRLYALSVGSLADRIGGASAPSLPTDDEPIRLEEMRQLQTDLKKLGHYTRAIDGVFGSGTRKAIAAFQKTQGLAPDGHLNRALLEKVATAAQAQ